MIVKLQTSRRFVSSSSGDEYLGVVVNVVLPAAHGPAHRPARGQGQLAGVAVWRGRGHVAGHLRGHLLLVAVLGQRVRRRGGPRGRRQLRHLLQYLHLRFVVIILWCVPT